MKPNQKVAPAIAGFVDLFQYMVGRYGHSGFSRCENIRILTSNREANVGNNYFLGILDKNGQNFGIFMTNGTHLLQ